MRRRRQKQVEPDQVWSNPANSCELCNEGQACGEYERVSQAAMAEQVSVMDAEIKTEDVDIWCHRTNGTEDRQSSRYRSCREGGDQGRAHNGM